MSPISSVRLLLIRSCVGTRKQAYQQSVVLRPAPNGVGLFHARSWSSGWASAFQADDAGSIPAGRSTEPTMRLTFRDSAMAWSRISRHERGYGTAHDKMRAHLLATVITCEECTRQGRETPGHVADHIKPLAKGGTGARSNYQLLCQDCSDVKTLADKGHTAKPRGGADLDGMPTDTDHPWNRGT